MNQKRIEQIGESLQSLPEEVIVRLHPWDIPFHGLTRLLSYSYSSHQFSYNWNADSDAPLVY